MAFLSWLESTSYAGWILFGTGWQIMLTLHAIGLAIVVGTVVLVDLRILGWYKPLPCAALGQLLSLAWIGIALNVFTGFSLFMSQATSYVTNVPFLLKMLLIVLGIVNLVRMSKALKEESATWDATRTVSRRGRILAITSLALWLGAVVTARLIAYLV